MRATVQLLFFDCSPFDRTELIVFHCDEDQIMAVPAACQRKVPQLITNKSYGFKDDPLDRSILGHV